MILQFLQLTVSLTGVVPGFAQQVGSRFLTGEQKVTDFSKESQKQNWKLEGGGSMPKILVLVHKCLGFCSGKCKLKGFIGENLITGILLWDIC